MENLETIFDHQIERDKRGAKYRLVKRPEEDELGPVLEPPPAEDPPLALREFVPASQHAQLKQCVAGLVEDVG